ncbi:MAG: BMP family ABC transporter substrate-binding protein [Thermotogaceae bacterium]|nr:BMP family ABC transporter substrate-binding protein [Thermotogaceae bacterium]
MKKFLVTILIISSVIMGFSILKVGFLYIGPVGDFGWTYAHDLGRKYLEDHVPGVITTYIENVPESIESYRYIEDLVKKDYKIIFATSFGFMDATEQAAKKYPDVYFFHCSGYKYNNTNFTAYFGRIYQPSFLAGIIAGMMTKSNIIGYVAPVPIPEVIRITNAFALGVKLVNPEAKVHVVWTHSWFDPAQEKEAAKSLMDVGADVIAQQTDSAAPVQTAEENGVYSIGYNSDMAVFGPSYYLGAPIWNWGAYYVKVVKEIMAGTYKAGFYWGGMDEDIVKISMTNNVPDKVKAVVGAFEKLIKEGKFDPFTGPIYNQKGELMVKEGERMSDEELLSMDWFVDNIVGSIPKASH